MFYEEKDRAKYTGNEFVAICKAFECADVEEVAQPDGSSRPGQDVSNGWKSHHPKPDSGEHDHNGQCRPNDLQQNIWREEEAEVMTPVYIAVVIIIVAVLGLGIWIAFIKKESAAADNVELAPEGCVNYTWPALLQPWHTSDAALACWTQRMSSRSIH